VPVSMTIGYRIRFCLLSKVFSRSGNRQGFRQYSAIRNA
jgi:hypothetical protein